MHSCLDIINHFQLLYSPQLQQARPVANLQNIRVYNQKHQPAVIISIEICYSLTQAYTYYYLCETLLAQSQKVRFGGTSRGTHKTPTKRFYRLFMVKIFLISLSLFSPPQGFPSYVLCSMIKDNAKQTFSLCYEVNSSHFKSVVKHTHQPTSSWLVGWLTSSLVVTFRTTQVYSWQHDSSHCEIKKGVIRTFTDKTKRYH